ncbi:hypothetical protein WR25_09263 [Diploscapter pachys]|uniref:Sulfhydryl oxidase n=1 Tax=Diploscapter pachys TaxID=2018661 RepID=A0A2A2KW22_9BILA|nr:hypothetical protein WR25_09263 [Diploscapter pachys]
MLRLLLLHLWWLIPLVASSVASYGTQPKGANPTLYTPQDLVIQLDEFSFNDTVFCAFAQGQDCPAFLVEMYSDWCGHCRSFAPLYKALADDVAGWGGVVKVAAMNCADSINEKICRSLGVQYFPYIKYFGKNMTDDGQTAPLLRPYQTLAEMRDQLTKVVIDDYSVNRFPGWPVFEFMGEVVTYGDLWLGAPPSAQHMAIVFESSPTSLVGAQLLLDLHKYRDRLISRRCLRNHPLVEALHITDFPSLAIFKRGEKKPVLVAELRRLLLREVEDFLGGPPVKNEVQSSMQFSSRKNKTTVDCEKQPEVCRDRYYVSEVDMLKSMRYALYRETARTGTPLELANLTALHSFVTLLADHFPVVSEGDNMESVGHPFPVNAEWEHCKGTTGQYRGYTCGLWTTFHALTVSVYKHSAESATFNPLASLQAIRDWVGNFFGCMHCRDHFLRMTTQTFKMEAQVRNPEDVYLYLWKAHNIVNARLKGRDTEDPNFLKYQFPATFLCTNCTTESGSKVHVQEFLLDYYSRIRPFHDSTSASLFDSLLAL